MSNYADIKLNDFSAGDGVSLTVYFQGCDKHCKGCHNPETWDFEKGHEFTDDTILYILENMTANGIYRNLAVMGGEPLHPLNHKNMFRLTEHVKKYRPDAKIYVWTGYTLDELFELGSGILDATLICNVDFLIAGPYIEEERDITLKWRGSRNQRIITKEEIKDYYLDRLPKK
jgi:anaerobic ribonucleoside-triphosphate reductase activating protein